ncbi:hypothetical protein BLNAU_6910 [Blattamonas nauphoetae]|uniref:Uncharacterized protein n=1 Tax=Blattamonas nauphoetae TaxID=2049346 RepID=A0ABQ9Y391_9EUKA|nr:hypothetical protein BLNAU_6910 [Blattamonas nauphoetae]
MTTLVQLISESFSVQVTQHCIDQDPCVFLRGGHPETQAVVHFEEYVVDTVAVLQTIKMPCQEERDRQRR